MGVAALTRPLAAAQRPSLGLQAVVLKSLPLLLGLIIVSPLLLLVVNSFNVAAVAQPPRIGFGNWAQAFGDEATLGALWNSLSLALTRTAISTPVALLLTWLIARTDMPGRSIVELLAWLSIFTPVLPLTLGWILLLDPHFGLINAGLAALGLHGHEFNVYGFWGITWVYLASNSVAYKIILLVPAFRRVGAATEDAARVCGASLWKATLRITLPLLAPAILLVTLISLVFSFEGFEVELLLGEPVRFYVYSTRIYDLVTNQPPYVGEATALGFVFLVWLVGLTVLYQWFIHRKSYATVGQGYVSRAIPLGRWRWPATVCCIGFFLLAMGVPFTLLVMGSFMRLFGFFNVQNAFTSIHWHELLADSAFGAGVRNSLLISTITAVVVILLYSTVAYAILRVRSRSLQITDRLVWAPWAMPGMLMSLGFLWFYLSTPARGLLYGSLGGIILAFIIRGSPLSTQFFKTSLLKIGRELEEGARVCGASWGYMYRRILLRLLAPTAVTVGLISFLTSIYDISTPALLYSAKSRPLALLMLEYSFSGARERGAAIGVLITGFVVVVLLLARSFGYRLSRDRL
ncbi:MAG TPA: iron ABC transporter permease [Chloroflexota bacterium]